MTDDIYERVVGAAFRYQERHGCGWDEMIIRLSYPDYHELRKEMTEVTRHTGALNSKKSPHIFRSKDVKDGDVDILGVGGDVEIVVDGEVS